MDYFMIILRLIHIFAGVFWVGGALFSSFFVVPSINATGDAGQQFMRHLATKTRLSARMAAAGGATVLAGLLLYWLDSDGFSSSWSQSGPGIGFGIGGAIGLLGFIFGILVGRNNRALGALGAEIKGKPTEVQAAKFAAIQKSQDLVGPLTTILLILATIFMAVARYLVF